MTCRSESAVIHARIDGRIVLPVEKQVARSGVRLALTVLETHVPALCDLRLRDAAELVHIIAQGVRAEDLVRHQVDDKIAAAGDLALREDHLILVVRPVPGDSIRSDRIAAHPRVAAK